MQPKEFSQKAVTAVGTGTVSTAGGRRCLPVVHGQCDRFARLCRTGLGLATRGHGPLPFVHGHATAAAEAHPADAVPALAAFSPRVQAFHFAVAIAPLSRDPCHGAPKNVVNINSPF